MIGGATCFAGHITICDNAMITGMTAVTKSIANLGFIHQALLALCLIMNFVKTMPDFIDWKI